MAGKSNIEWTGHTWNPLAGCSVLTLGCKRCYAMKLAKRLGAMGNPLYAGLTKDTNGGAVWTGEMRKAPRHTLLEPLRRKKPTTWFVNSMSDLFHENVPDEWIDEIFAVMALSPQHTFQVLTKRAGRMREYLTAGRTVARSDIRNHLAWDTTIEVMRAWFPDWIKEDIDGPHRSRAIKAFTQWPLPNVWLGVSTERQQEADERIPLLLQTPAAVRFISAEPLLGPIDLDKVWCDAPGENWLDWVIVGGESGGGYRDMDQAWAKSLIDQCVGAGVAVFMKQMAGKKPIPPELLVREMPTAHA